MEKFNPQPEPPARGSSIYDWIMWLIQYIVWIITLPFQTAAG